MDKRITAWVNAHREQMVSDICELIRVKSCRGEAAENAPFGDGPAAALAAAEKIAARMGLKMTNYANYVGTFDLSDRPQKLAILAHLDVVPEGDGWSVCKPYEPVVTEGRIYGRGSADDKGPAIAAMYALAAAKELGGELPFSTRLILGTAEETGSEDLQYYFSKEKAPEMSFSPDADYPLINLEKGSYSPLFGAKWEQSSALPRVSRLHGGTVNNIVPRTAWALVNGLDAQTVKTAADKAAAATGVSFEVSDCDGGIKISAVGVSAHASTPEKGNNAQTALIALLNRLPLADCGSSRALSALEKVFPHGDTEGRAVGIAQSDEISGALTLNFGIIELDENGCSCRFDSRLPVCCNAANTLEPVCAALESAGLTVFERGALNPPHFTPPDSRLVKTLLDIYTDATGKKGECLAIGGGTYVHHIEGGVAFGCADPEVDNRMHGADEFALIDALTNSCAMFCEAILRLCGKEE